jgi:hypothetical protein
MVDSTAAVLGALPVAVRDALPVVVPVATQRVVLAG